jgi:hypothetical protein
MKEYRYVIVASDGTSHDLADRKVYSNDFHALPDLLEDGWQPVREIPIGPGQWFVGEHLVNFPLALILLEREED